MLIADPFALLLAMSAMSAADLDALIDGLRRPELRPTPAHDLARASALGARYAHDNDPETLDAALRTYEKCSYRGRVRGIVGRDLALRYVMSAMAGRQIDENRARALIEDAGDDPAMPGSAAVLTIMTDMLAALGDDLGFDREEALRRLDEASSSVPPESPLARIAANARVALAIRQGTMIGSYAASADAVELAREMLTREDLSDEERTLAKTLLTGAEGMAAAQHGELDSAMSSVDTLTDMVDGLPAGHPAALAARTQLAALHRTDATDAEDPGLSPAERAWRLMTAGHNVVQAALKKQDTAELSRGMALLRRAERAAPDGYEHRVLLLTVLGSALVASCQWGGGRPALDEALRRLTAAQEEARHPGHPMWATSAQVLGLAYRADGRAARGRECGRRSMRGHAWSVLLQAGTADAVAAARSAANDARQVARWFLADGEPAGAAAVLDAGRCLMLYATTVTMDVPARLTGLGRDDLLARWRNNPNDPDLRYEVLTVLTGADVSEAAVPEILDPPGADEIGRALTAVRADVLVYLIPKDDEGPGGALLVPSDALSGVRPAFLPLPRLATTEPVTRHVEALGTRDAGEADRKPGSPIDEVCDWAWPAVVGPLLDTLDRWPIGRAPRLVLVPMGDLAAVPWHAARDRDGTRAVEIATFSYAPSARLLCQNSERPPVDPAAPALMIADPEGNLPDARAEADAIRAAFLSSAALRHGAEATPETVRDWLLAGGGAVLHLACHGAVRPGVDGSYLRLADSRRLTAHEILRTRRTTAIGLVALAACTTGVPSGAYDEAFSLATAFLTAGARSVFGSLWPVPSEATSLLMFMAHHYLWAEHKRPMDALNHAQRWMLNPDRETPPTMPPRLRALVPSLTGDVTAWAGFTHQGW
ncbi:CHAT domain-containing protein [Paractinoplanes globisporus]|uniref:CHAT domain-containing protein n=1 Tax=Paractinoplanes globisporus TaxID=113565 RepID=A0ABW6W9E7_9ACTN|nr:CHAT domain-containing protein [Actinoplanes globisporus]